MAQNFVIRKRMDEMQAEVQPEKEWWEKRRESISSEFMKELDQEAATNVNGKVPKTSDDEAVLVEAGGPTATGSQQPGGSVKNRKKKGKN